MTLNIQNGIKNPFSDSQARNYSDNRVISEFSPVSQFWTLFNDQHEVIIGSRGCGKTILLKMMRYSMLRKLRHKKAEEMIREKKYISFYVPLHLEFIKMISNTKKNEEERIDWFRFSFNCTLGLSIISELKALLEDTYAEKAIQFKKEIELTHIINSIWKLSKKEELNCLNDLGKQISRIYYSLDINTTDTDKIPVAFKHTIGSCLSAITFCLCEMFNISPTWIVCIDEAEFLDECYQKCINTAFRADTMRITYKMATLPFYHVTKKTIDNEIEVMNGQDFKYTIIDLKYDQADFKKITDTIVSNRLAKEGISITKLEQFVETFQEDIYLTYYKNEMGEEKSNPKQLMIDILNQRSGKVQKMYNNKDCIEVRKSLINKYSPILYVREIRKTKKGRHVPLWYAGATMIRRVAQGNPRLFIRIMNDLFENGKGKKIPIKMKIQHQTIERFAESFCKETEALESVGPEAKEYLDIIAKRLQDRTHANLMTLVGTAFTIDEEDLKKTSTKWLERAAAFSRIKADNYSISMGISKNTIFELSNIYAAHYWLPMRPKPVDKMNNLGKAKDEYKVATIYRKKDINIPGQISMDIEGVNK